MYLHYTLLVGGVLLLHGDPVQEGQGRYFELKAKVNWALRYIKIYPLKFILILFYFPLQYHQITIFLKIIIFSGPTTQMTEGREKLQPELNPGLSFLQKVAPAVSFSIQSITNFPRTSAYTLGNFSPGLVSHWIFWRHFEFEFYYELIYQYKLTILDENRITAKIGAGDPNNYVVPKNKRNKSDLVNYRQ